MIYCFGMKNKPNYKSLLQERDKVTREISNYAFVLRASLRRHGNICGNPTCRCKHPTNPKPHGPYNYLSHRYKDKTQTIFLTKKKLSYAKEGIDNYKEFLTRLYRLSEINFQILRYHYDRLEEREDVQI